MKLEDAKVKLGHFTSRDESRRSISEVAVMGGFAYATDGRIGVRWAVDGAEDYIPEGYPAIALKDIVTEVDSIDSWYTVEHGSYESISKEFLEAYKNARENEETSNRSRYEVCACPCCGETLYWDRDNGRLVPEDGREEPWHLLPRELQYPVIMRFGDVKSIVNFGYVFTALKVMGDDSFVALGGGHCGKIMFKSRDGDVAAVLMPLFPAALDGDDKPTELKLVEHGDA